MNLKMICFKWPTTIQIIYTNQMLSLKKEKQISIGLKAYTIHITLNDSTIIFNGFIIKNISTKYEIYQTLKD